MAPNTATADAHTLAASQIDTTVLDELLKKLSASGKSEESESLYQLCFRSHNEVQAEFELSREALTIFVKMLKEFTSKQGEVSTQQAADYLNVSRPYLIKLLEKGLIAYRKVGTHRRIKMIELAKYRDDVDRLRDEALNGLSREAQSLELEY
ncbi:MAG: excisionase family DNA-binding protein [Bacteroidota bacterium]